jgi:protein RecA
MARTRKRETPPASASFDQQEQKEEKKKLGPLDTFIAQVEKERGPLVIRPASSIPSFSMISTGAFMLDFALMGGVPETLATLLFGGTNSGKTTIANRIIASAQRKHDDRRAAMVDMEGTYDTTWAAYHGVDLDRLLLVQPTSGEEAVDLIVGLIETGELSVIVGDSVAMMTPTKIIDDSAADINVSPLARLMTIFGNKLTVALNAARKMGHPTTVVLTNQWRSKIGVMYGDPRTLPGGININDYVPMTKIELKSKEVHTGTRLGEFQMAIAHDHPQGPGTFLDAETLALYARKFEFITGSPQAGWNIRDVDGSFRKLEEITNFLYAEAGEMLRLKQRVISAQRVSKGLLALPQDGFLLDWNAFDNLA